MILEEEMDFLELDPVVQVIVGVPVLLIGLGAAVVTIAIPRCKRWLANNG